MEIEIISSGIIVNADLQVNFDHDNLHELTDFAICIPNGTRYKCHIMPMGTGVTDDTWDWVGFDVRMPDVRNLQVFMVDGMIIDDSKSPKKPEFDARWPNHGGILKNSSDPEKQFYGVRFQISNITGKMKSIKGQLSISFEPTNKIYLNQKFHNYFAQKLLKPIDRLGQKKDFKIICEDQEFIFNQNILTNVSKVFQRMIENQCTNESNKGTVKIEEFLPITIETFRVGSS